MTSGQRLLTACDDLWITCNLHFCMTLCLCMGSVNTWREPVASSGFCYFTFMGLFNTVQPHESECQCSVKWILVRNQANFVTEGKQHFRSGLHQLRAHSRCRDVRFLVYLVYMGVKHDQEMSLSVVFSGCRERREMKSFFKQYHQLKKAGS